MNSSHAGCVYLDEDTFKEKICREVAASLMLREWKPMKTVFSPYTDPYAYMHSDVYPLTIHLNIVMKSQPSLRIAWLFTFYS